MGKGGILVAGNIIADVIKRIGSYPQRGMLSVISSVTRGVGGCVPNVAVDLAKMGGISVGASGRIGDDNEGAFIVDVMRDAGVDTSGILVTGGTPTAFTDVMTLSDTGERTFFSYSGANDLFCAADIILPPDTEILHIGYLLLLGALDAPDEIYGTKMAALLNDMQQRGVKTSVDAVSSSGGDFAQKILPALKFCDYAILNEIEAGAAAGIEPRDRDGRLLPDNIRIILETVIDCGAGKAVVHCPEAGFMCGRDKRVTAVPSLSLPPGYIQGAVGAGDAFCAGMLYALHRGFADSDALAFASLSAAANLSKPDSVSGARSYADICKLEGEFKRQNLDWMRGDWK